MKTRFVRIVSSLLVLSMAAGLAACGGQSAPAASSDAPKAETPAVAASSESEPAADLSTVEGWGASVKQQSDGKQITVAMAAHPSTDAFKTMADEFTGLTGIKVVWDIVEETNLKNKQLLDSSGAGSYDVFMVDAFWMSEYASKDILLPIETFASDTAKTPAWFDYEDIMPAYRNGIAGANGVNYGIPSAGETRFIAYRTDLFEKYEKQPPKTMDEF